MPQIDEKPEAYSEADFRLFQTFKDGLNSGAVRAGAQIGGVLETVGALPVILEDAVMVGGNTNAKLRLEDLLR